LPRIQRWSPDRHARKLPSSPQSPNTKWDVKCQICPWLASQTTGQPPRLSPLNLQTHSATTLLLSLTSGARKMQAPQISDSS
jgi:hypothetical protein